MQSRWMTWKGREVLYQDFSGFRSDVAALDREVQAVDAVICAQRPGTVLALADLRETVASPAVVQLFKASAARTKPYIARQALIGISGIKRFLADKVARFAGQGMRLFDAEAEALDWLIGSVTVAGEEIGRD